MTLADVWQLRDGTVNVIAETTEKISALGLANSAAVKHPAGTVILSRTASVGFSAILGINMATSQDFATWACGGLLNPRYLLYSLRAMTPELRRLAAGSTHKTIYMPDIASLQIPLPPNDEQHRIVDFLDAETSRMDALTWLRQAQRTVVEERRQAAAEAALASGTWERMKLRYAGVRVTTGPFGTSFAASEYVSGGVPMINPTHIVEGKIVPGEGHTVGSDTAARLKRHRLRKGDIVVGRKGDIGRAALVSDAEDGWICGSDSIALHSSGLRLLPLFIAHLLSLGLVRSQLLRESVGATMPNLNERNLLNLQVPVPPLQRQQDLIEDFEKLGWWAHATTNRFDAQLALLAERRQALITAAVTGQIDVTTARGSSE